MMLNYYNEYCVRPLLFDRVCSGRTPLHWAARVGKADICDILLKNDANVNAEDNL
jgi:ankyrin repeat protein